MATKEQDKNKIEADFLKSEFDVSRREMAAAIDKNFSFARIFFTSLVASCGSTAASISKISETEQIAKKFEVVFVSFSAVFIVISLIYMLALISNIGFIFSRVSYEQRIIKKRLEVLFDNNNILSFDVDDKNPFSNLWSSSNALVIMLAFFSIFGLQFVQFYIFTSYNMPYAYLVVAIYFIIDVIISFYAMSIIMNIIRSVRTKWQE